MSDSVSSYHVLTFIRILVDKKYIEIEYYGQIYKFRVDVYASNGEDFAIECGNFHFVAAYNRMQHVRENLHFVTVYNRMKIFPLCD